MSVVSVFVRRFIFSEYNNFNRIIFNNFNSPTVVCTKTESRLLSCSNFFHTNTNCCRKRKNFLSNFQNSTRNISKDRNNEPLENNQKLENQSSPSEVLSDNEDQILVDYWRGLPRITVPLPSRKEKCRFILKPISNTVGDFIEMIRIEDHGIDRVVLSTKDGVRIASSNSIELLLQEDEFYLIINDQKFVVKVPEAQTKSFTKEGIEKLSDVRGLVYQLYETLEVNEFHVRKEKELVARLEEIQSLLEPLEKREALEKRANLRTSVLTWVGLGMMGVQFGILARLTWWEYSWDIMEPVTYFVTYGTAMACYAYFCITKQDYILPEIRDRQHLISIHKRGRRIGFDLIKYNNLREQLASVQTDLSRLRDPLYYHPHRSSLRPDISNINDKKQYNNNYYSNINPDYDSAIDYIKNYILDLKNKIKQK